MRLNNLLLLALLGIQLANCSAQSIDGGLDKNLTKIYKESNFLGFAIAIVKGDSTLFANSYGYADKGKKTPYTLQTDTLEKETFGIQVATQAYLHSFPSIRRPKLDAL